MQIYLVLALTFSIGVAVFAVQNATGVDINFFFWQLQNISLVVVIFGSALIGALAAGLFGIVKQLKLKIELRSCKSLMEGQKAEIDYWQKKNEESVKPSGEKEGLKDNLDEKPQDG